MNKKKLLIPIILFTVLIVLVIVFIKTRTRYNKIYINESKWNSIISSKSENTNLILNFIEFNGYRLLIDEKNNTIYYSLINDSSTKYNPRISFMCEDKNAKVAILEEEITEEKVKTNYKFKVMIYNEKEYHIYNLVCTDFPILNIEYLEEAGDKQKNIPIEIYLFDNLTRTPRRITVSEGNLKINGENLKFSLNMMTPGKNKRENRLSIFNMPPNSEFTLTKVTGEATKINQQLKNFYVELFINNEYQGKYILGFANERNNI